MTVIVINCNTWWCVFCSSLRYNNFFFICGKMVFPFRAEIYFAFELSRIFLINKGYIGKEEILKQLCSYRHALYNRHNVGGYASYLYSGQITLSSIVSRFLHWMIWKLWVLIVLVLSDSSIRTLNILVQLLRNAGSKSLWLTLNSK